MTNPWSQSSPLYATKLHPPALPFGGGGALGGLQGQADQLIIVKYTPTASAGCAARCTSTAKEMVPGSSKSTKSYRKITIFTHLALAPFLSKRTITSEVFFLLVVRRSPSCRAPRTCLRMSETVLSVNASALHPAAAELVTSRSKKWEREKDYSTFPVSVPHVVSLAAHTLERHVPALPHRRPVYC